jgi:alpha-L-fucosidase 2
LLINTVSLSLTAQSKSSLILSSPAIPTSWDEGFPLGNGMIGVLVWQKGNMLRLSVDRADLWDLRPTAELEKYSYQWAYQHRLSGDWDTVWKVADEPYDRDATPTKIPGAAVEFDISGLGSISSASLDLSNAVCTIKWKNGVVFNVFVDAHNPVIRYTFTNKAFVAALIPPEYQSNSKVKTGNAVVGGQSLARLGYTQGKVEKKDNILIYNQNGWGDFKYQVAVSNSKQSKTTEGVISISSNYGELYPGTLSTPDLKTANGENAFSVIQNALASTYERDLEKHKDWWQKYWQQSSISIPDPVLEKQWYLEMYKFGAASRPGGPPISLQAVWTADNGKLPPWKGDFHSDLNTQLSYWPAYSSNHLEEGAVFTDWLWNNRGTFKANAKKFFNADGLNVPGVATLTGEAMGGWHMYALSPTVAAWLSQHFYLQWRFSMDRSFLDQKAYPWVANAALFLEQITVFKDGIRKLPMGSSPEFNDGNMTAWFLEPTNYDLALCKYLYKIAAEMARELKKDNEAAHWEIIGSQFPDFDVDSITGLTVAPGYPYKESHRHFSHLMAVHPMGILNFDDPNDREIIEKSAANLEKQGPDWWCGYSYSWAGNIYARMKDGEKAAEKLKLFASCFCLPNSFHVNGDQCKAGHSKFTYRPFTLEGNFAFAAGLQEMLLQSHAGYIEVFPAVPNEWKDISFNNLRTEGAFLVSATKENSVPVKVRIEAPKGGNTLLQLPYLTHVVKQSNGVKIDFSEAKKIYLQFEPGGFVEFENGYE